MIYCVLLKKQLMGQLVMMSDKDVFRRLVYDYYFLISRGYPPQQAFSLISSRYSIDKYVRTLLRRCVHGREINELISLLKVNPGNVYGEMLCIDGYNQFYTLGAAISGRKLYRCSDGIIRDNELGSLQLGGEILARIYGMISTALNELRPSRVILVLDKRKELIKDTDILAEQLTMPVETFFVEKADKLLLSLSHKCIVSSSDILVLLGSERIFDLVGYIVAILGIRVNDISSLLEEEEKKWCAGP